MITVPRILLHVQYHGLLRGFTFLATGTSRDFNSLQQAERCGAGQTLKKDRRGLEENEATGLHHHDLRQPRRRIAPQAIARTVRVCQCTLEIG